jgi:choline kinase
MTAERPKCLVELGGRPLADWQAAALHAAGIEEVVLVTGYRAEMLQGYGTRRVHNPRWAESNMVSSLLCASEAFDGPVIVSYADIVYDTALVRALMAAQGDIVVAYDTDWLDLWSRRFDDPLSDAESFAVDSQFRVRDIGRKVADISQIQGQYMGLLRITPTALGWIREAVQLSENGGDTMDMTSLLAGLIAAGHPVHGLPCSGGWCEIDNERDLAVAEALLAEGRLGAAPDRPRLAEMG